VAPVALSVAGAVEEKTTIKVTANRDRSPSVVRSALEPVVRDVKRRAEGGSAGSADAVPPTVPEAGSVGSADAVPQGRSPSPIPQQVAEGQPDVEISDTSFLRELFTATLQDDQRCRDEQEIAALRNEMTDRETELRSQGQHELNVVRGEAARRHEEIVANYKRVIRMSYSNSLAEPEPMPPMDQHKDGIKDDPAANSVINGQKV
jgi:hypothetical protein